MKSIKYLFVIAALGLLFNSCTKEVAGPTGPTGPQGAQGPSNNFVTLVDSIPVANWSTSSPFYATFSNLGLLSEPNTSNIEVYCSQTYSKSNSGVAQWYDLSCPNVLITGDYMYYSYTTYSLTILYINAASTAPTNAELYFKIVVITNP
jgi:hypothetical protein